MERHSNARTTQAVAANVRAELARRNIQQQELAAALGWSKVTTYRRLTGQLRWYVDDVTAVADFLGIPSHFLMPAEAVA
ncbi:XRE family transcriptional regulator [Phycicoccus sp. HDW14]|uniref:helix-turn-helix domain-containing protein n=1 Tax=Phycicoccus sp. HDW14 TaxID=2714941 RepID=UPI001407F040|nr:helix-turn-helix domain-containing protein [Phycicoccus sp. HDW14]QIM20574.1 XRE family transcriptional regulator [Phycicoccus sp. HDW14]